MLQQLPTLQKLIRQLQKLPYLASRNVYRVAVHFLTTDRASIDQLCQAIVQAKSNIKACKVCFNWTEQQDLCSICAHPGRDKQVICVIETWYDLFALERVGDYKGLYHVLGGSLCPLEGVGPEDLTIVSFLKRLETEKIKEIIFATNPTPEGEATASYIASKISSETLVITKLASGVPTGSSLELMDRITIAKALAGRRPF